MLEVPQRRRFATRDEFLADFNAALAELQNAYRTEPVRNVPPSWPGAFYVALPTDIARTQRGEFALLRSLLLGLKNKNVELKAIARVETAGMTTLWARCDGCSN